jgi:hypothetical protein
MNKQKFLSEVQDKLIKIFNASKEGYKVPEVQRCRLEGFIHAGVFMKLVSNAEIQELINETHLSIFNMTIEERKLSKGATWSDESIDYSQYDMPTFER